MNGKLQINTRVRRLFHYIDDFQKGIIRVPAFQREFVWKMKDKIELFESLRNGYPIGSILFWRPDSKTEGDLFQFESERIGSYYIPSKDNDFFYILDGYQRISTLFGCLVNPTESGLDKDEKEWFEKFNLVYNLQLDRFEQNRKKNLDELEIFRVPVYKFVDGKEFFGFQKLLFNSKLSESVIEDYIRKYENLSARLVDYQLPSIDIIGGDAVDAVEIFSKVNSTGVRLSDDWKISALSFNPAKNFRLGSEIDQLLEDLKIYNFSNIKRNLILQCIINSFGKVFFDQSNPKVIEELAVREDFIDITRTTIKSIRKAIHFLFNELGVLSSKLLPYNNQLIFITDFFVKESNPSATQLNSLKKWFWTTSYSTYFTIYNLSKQRLAYQRFQEFIYNNIDPVYIDNPNKPFVISKFPGKITMGSVRAKSLALFMLNHVKNSTNSTENISGYKILPLFKSSKEEDLNVSENTVMVVYDAFSESYFKKINNLSPWLTDTSNHREYFITDNIKRLYNNSLDKYEVLEARRREIISAEKEFVESLGLIIED